MRISFLDLDLDLDGEVENGAIRIVVSRGVLRLSLWMEAGEAAKLMTFLGPLVRDAVNQKREEQSP